MDIETDPRLWADPLWSRLANARTVLLDNPRILWEKEHDWEEGLNAKGINRRVLSTKTSTKRVYERSVEKNGSLVVARTLRVHHPGPPPPVEVVTWHRNVSAIPPDTAVQRILAYLQAWMDSRAAMLKTSVSVPTPDLSPPPPSAAPVSKAAVSKLSLKERRILVALRQRDVDWRSRLRPSTMHISGWTGLVPNSGFKATLSAMVKAKWLGNRRNHGERGGYYLTSRGVEAGKLLDRS